jgi:hypothetical protein
MRHETADTGCPSGGNTCISVCDRNTRLGASASACIAFKVVTVKDEVVIGLNTQELQALGGPEKAPAGVVASALAGRKELTVWQYAVRKAANGDSEMAPLHQIGLLPHESLRVVPYSTPFAVLPHN